MLENQVYVAVTGEYRLCCTSQEPTSGETVWTHSPIEWLNSNLVTTTKDTFAKGEWPASCIRCKLEEDAGLQSRRISRDFLGPEISHLDLRFGNSCNLKCISCWSQSSSSINEEAIEMQSKGIIPLHTIHHKSVENWYDEKFFSYFEDLPLKEVALAGGEPMMVKHLDEFLERLDPSVTVRFTTNGTIFNSKIHKLLKKFNKVIMTFSADAVGKRIEYIRYGSKWDTIENNILKYAEFCDVNLSPCISVLNALYYEEVKVWASLHNFKIYDNFLLHPDYLHVKNAPDSLKQQITSIDNWMNFPADVEQQEIFIKNISTLDNFRNISIKDYLPEVAAAYGIS
jgi:organic radical activating enzyme